MMIKIKNWVRGDVIFKCEADSLLVAVEIAVGKGVSLKYADLRNADLRGAKLGDANLGYANLRDADLGYADLCNANLRDADFGDANLSNADLRYADLGDADLRNAILVYANLSYAILSNANLSNAYLGYADLRNAILVYANLSYAILSNANLSNAYLGYADLRGAKHNDAILSRVPVIKNIHQSVYIAASAPRALNMSDWHTCETTHCRAGWVVHLAGDAGKELEQVCSTPLAATLIYMASDPGLKNIPDFYATKQDALDDMKRLADQESAA